MAANLPWLREEERMRRFLRGFFAGLWNMTVLALLGALAVLAAGAIGAALERTPPGGNNAEATEGSRQTRAPPATRFAATTSRYKPAP